MKILDSWQVSCCDKPSIADSHHAFAEMYFQHADGSLEIVNDDGKDGGHGDDFRKLDYAKVSDFA